ncbi:hypothetical protein ACWDA7_30430 [Streptomyces sp. NPDC001156]
MIEPNWLGTKVPHRVLCAAGHEAEPRPGDVNRGIGLCVICAGKDQSVAWRLFLQLVAERGGEVLEPKPLGVNTPHRVRCSVGHETKATPSYVRVGGGICPVCAPTSTARAEQRFRSFVEASGGRVLEPQWLGAKKPHRVICAHGHETSPRPFDVQQSGCMCRVCSGHDSAASWRAFQDRVTELGGTVAEPKWLGNKVPHNVVCAKGHLSLIRPNNVQQGGGICRTCAYKVWDVFYVVANDAARAVKFGITSYDPRARLRHHRADGFDRVVTTITDMPEAPELERKIITSLRSAGAEAIAGREYFDLSALPMILRVVDNW